MVKIFFPAFGVGFSELYKVVLPFCHFYVSKIIEEFWSQNAGLLFPFPRVAFRVLKPD